jgi:eukaryotic-like serine/threonine-protein kinase
MPIVAVVTSTPANPGKPTDIGKPAQAAAKAPQQSPELHRLVELRAYVIWVKGGRPTGRAGELVQKKNWHKAETQILDEVKQRAFKIWDQQGRPTGAAGEAVREKNMRAAEAQLLKETEDELRRHPVD